MTLINILAYIGPGLGVGTIALILVIVLIIVISILLILWIPIKNLIKRVVKFFSK